jgi:hypothetical protein
MARIQLMFADLCLALGFLLTTATQLRIPGSPIGPGELLLTFWLVIAIGRGLLLRDFASNRALGQLLLFWLLFAASLCIGTIVAIATDEALDLQWFLHDAMAYPLVGMMVCLTVAGRNAQAHLDRVAWLFAALGSSSLALLVAAGQGQVPLTFDPWFWERFRGWSQNPNQLSELCAALTLVSLHLFDTSRRLHSRVAALFCMSVSLYTGVLTQSDTFRYAVFVAIPLFIVLGLRARLNIGWSASFALVIMACALSAYTLIVPLPLPSVGIRGSDISAILSKEGGKTASHEAALRESLWGQALHRGFFDSWMLGLGPGPHLMIPPEIVAAHANSTGLDAPGNTVHPKADGTANFEAHNTLLDLFTQGGLLAIGSFLWLLATAFRRTFTCERPGLIALLAGFGVFIVTGNIIRMPTLWFGLALCLVAERQPVLRPLSGRHSSLNWNFPRNSFIVHVGATPSWACDRVAVRRS